MLDQVAENRRPVGDTIRVLRKARQRAWKRALGVQPSPHLYTALNWSGGIATGALAMLVALALAMVPTGHGGNDARMIAFPLLAVIVVGFAVFTSLQLVVIYRGFGAVWKVFRGRIVANDVYEPAEWPYILSLARRKSLELKPILRAHRTRLVVILALKALAIQQFPNILNLFGVHISAWGIVADLVQRNALALVLMPLYVATILFIVRLGLTSYLRDIHVVEEAIYFSGQGGGDYAVAVQLRDQIELRKTPASSNGLERREEIIAPTSPSLPANVTINADTATPYRADRDRAA